MSHPSTKFNINDIVEINSDPDSDDDTNSHIHKGKITKKYKDQITLKENTQTNNYFIDEVSIKVIEKSAVKNQNDPNDKKEVPQSTESVIPLGRILKLVSKRITDIQAYDDSKSEFEYPNALNDWKEIAMAEGCNDMIISALTDISAQILNNDLSSAVKKINTIISEVMPFDCDEFFELFAATQKTAQTLKGKVCWVLLGPTGAGKSTSIHFFCGSQFKKGDSGSVTVDEIGQSLKGKDIKVGERVTESKTRHIESVKMDLSQFENEIQFGRNEPKQIFWVDTPGFEDTAGAEVNMANGIGSIRALKNAAKVKVVIVFKEAHLDYKFKIIRNIANNMGKAINNLEDELEKKNSPITGFLTKSHEGLENAEKVFAKAYNEQSNKEDTASALFKILIRKFGSGNSLHQIDIDVDNAQNNMSEGVHIIKSLVEKTGYMNNPNEQFNEFISESSLAKLKQQMSINHRTIQNILGNDTYFRNPNYVHYIVEILNSLERINEITQRAGGKEVQSKLADCVNVFETKWSDKILKCVEILANIDINQCTIPSLQKQLTQFDEARLILETNAKAIQSWKYYKTLKDTNSFNDGLHECFDAIYAIIVGYVSDTKNKLIIDESDSEEKDVEFKDSILLSVRKCCLLCKRYKTEYIRKKIEKFEHMVEEVTRYAKNKFDRFMKSKESQNINAVSKIQFMFSQLSQFNDILRLINENTNETEIMKELSNTLKETIVKNIENICKSYSLNVMDVRSTNAGNVNYNLDTLLKSRATATDDEKNARENKLLSFCAWIRAMHKSFRDPNLRKWLNDTQNKWNQWLCGACLAELNKCNDLLMNDGAQSWKNVQKLLNDECKSLRKVDYVSGNTNQEFFRTMDEFKSRKMALAKVASMVFGTDTNIDYDKVIRIAKQLVEVGCTEDSDEMKLIYGALKDHLKNLNCEAESITLSIQMSDDLIVTQNIMKELDRVQRFAVFMPNIETDTNECYRILHAQVLSVLNEIQSQYNLSHCSIQNLKTLKDKLLTYIDVKNGIDETVLTDVILKCESKTLTELIRANVDQINKLHNENHSIEEKIKETFGPKMKDIKECEALVKSGKKIILDDDLDEDDLQEWLNKVGFKTLKDIRNKLDELKEESAEIGIKERKESKNNTDKIFELTKINDEIQKVAKAENDLMLLLSVDKVIEYRINNTVLRNRIAELQQLVNTNKNHIFAQTLSLSHAYNALKFIHECKAIKWLPLHLVSNKFINGIQTKILKYLKAYGGNLESDLNDLMSCLAIKDIEKCDLNDSKYVTLIENAISELNDCLREFRKISGFDERKAQMEETCDDRSRKQLKLVPFIFSTNVDKCVNNIVSIHKQEMKISLQQWQSNRPDRLPVLRFICVSMSALDRFVSPNETYSQIASEIDGALRKHGSDNTAQIMPLIASKSWLQLQQTLASLKKTADANEHGIAQRTYNDAAMQLLCVWHKLVNISKNKILAETNKDNNISDKKILSLNAGLRDVQNLLNTIEPYLRNESERKRVKNEAIDLSVLLCHRWKQLMRAALRSARSKAFKQCQKRLNNVSKFMEYRTQFYIVTDNDIRQIVTAYQKMKKDIEEELRKVLAQVEKANNALRDPNVYNPYNRLRLIALKGQLIGSKNEEFRQLWDDIEQEIVSAVRDLLNEIRERNNQIQMQTEYGMSDESKTKPIMTYSQQQTCIRKIEMSLILFPRAMKDLFKTLLTEAKESLNSTKDAVPVQTEKGTIQEQREGETETEDHNELRKWFESNANFKIETDKRYYLNLLIENGFDDFDGIQTIKKGDLIDIGVTKLGHRRKILAAIEKLVTVKQEQKVAAQDLVESEESDSDSEVDIEAQKKAMFGGMIKRKSEKFKQKVDISLEVNGDEKMDENSDSKFILVHNIPITAGNDIGNELIEKDQKQRPKKRIIAKVEEDEQNECEDTNDTLIMDDPDKDYQQYFTKR